MLQASYLRDYPSKKKIGETVFVYAVTGTPEELSQFKTAQGTHYRVDEHTGTPLYFDTIYAGDVVTLKISSNNKTFIDLSEIRKAVALSKITGGNFGQALASTLASTLAPQLTSRPTSAPSSAPKTEEDSTDAPF